MTSDLEPTTNNEDEASGLPDITTPVDLRPDLTEFGIIEYDKGVCEDTFENRQILRAANFTWDYVYDQLGHSTGLISARSKEQLRERRLVNFSERRPLLTDPTNNNSDFLTGLDLIIDRDACKITPPWVVAATRAYLEEQEQGGPKSERRAPKGLPHRCKTVKSDGLRCLMWASGRLKDDGLCRYHLKFNRRPGGDIERARQKIVQSAPYAVDKLEELLDAQSEPVQLKAATEILDRAGVRGGIELNVEVESNGPSPHEVIAARMEQLRIAALHAIAEAAPETKIIDAEPVIEISTNGVPEEAEDR
jgi:hypothetical protein